MLVFDGSSLTWLVVASGADLIEYALLGSFIAIAAYLGVMSVGEGLSDLFTAVGSSIESQNKS